MKRGVPLFAEMGEKDGLTGAQAAVDEEKRNGWWDSALNGAMSAVFACRVPGVFAGEGEAEWIGLTMDEMIEAPIRNQ